MTATVEPYTDEQARAALFLAARTLQDVMGMIRSTMEGVDKADADAIHAAQIKAQRLRIEKMGLREREATIIRAHPLFSMWKMLMSACNLLERLLLITNPNLRPTRRKRSIDPEKAMVEADKLAFKAEAA